MSDQSEPTSGKRPVDFEVGIEVEDSHDDETTKKRNKRVCSYLRHVAQNNSFLNLPPDKCGGWLEVERTQAQLGYEIDVVRVAQVLGVNEKVGSSVERTYVEVVSNSRATTVREYIRVAGRSIPLRSTKFDAQTGESKVSDFVGNDSPVVKDADDALKLLKDLTRQLVNKGEKIARFGIEGRAERVQPRQIKSSLGKLEAAIRPDRGENMVEFVTRSVGGRERVVYVPEKIRIEMLKSDGVCGVIGNALGEDRGDVESKLASSDYGEKGHPWEVVSWGDMKLLRRMVDVNQLVEGSLKSLVEVHVMGNDEVTVREYLVDEKKKGDDSKTGREGQEFRAISDIAFTRRQFDLDDGIQKIQTLIRRKPLADWWVEVGRNDFRKASELSVVDSVVVAADVLRDLYDRLKEDTESEDGISLEDGE